MKRNTAINLAVLVVTSLCLCVGAEIVLRSYFARYAESHGNVDEMFSELRFLRDPLNRKDVSLGNTPHPTRGWVPQPNFKGENPRTTTNDRGHRASPDYTYQPGKYTVMVLGDSFTFGTEAGDDEVWPAKLQGLDKRLHVINEAVSGYGTDQMLITLNETFDEYKPQLVILAYITDDLRRALTGFIEYRKPRMVLRASGKGANTPELVITNTPVGSKSETYALLEKKYAFPYSFVLHFADILSRIRHVGSRAYLNEEYALNTRIFEEAEKCSRNGGAEFMLVHLPSPAGPYPGLGDEFLDAFVKTHSTPFLATQFAFLKVKDKWPCRHYRDPEALVVSNAVYEKIQTFDSWKRFVQTAK